jgi:hypothetical protein
MIEDVEELCPQLQIHPLEKTGVLGHREINIQWAVDFVTSRLPNVPTAGSAKAFAFK